MSSAREKRSHDAIDNSHLPPLPQITQAHISEQVFSHKSLLDLEPGSPNATAITTNERYSRLGRSLLNLLVTHFTFMESPPLRLDQFVEHVEDVVNRHTLAVWCSEYDLVRKMRTKDGYSLDSEEEKAQIFCAFIGGVLVDSDFSDKPVRSWLSGIMGRDVPVEEAAPLSKKPKLEKVSPKASPVIPPRYLVPTGQYRPDMVSAQPPIPHYAGGIQIGPESVHQKQFSSVMANDWTMSGNGGHLNQPIVPGIGVSPTLATHPAPYYPPPILGTPSLPPLATSPKGAPQPKTFLMKFNERIAQKKLKHEWQCKQEGWAHDGTWLVDCLVNGVVTGRARAKTKKSAKELAAQDASRNMSWIM